MLAKMMDTSLAAVMAGREEYVDLFQADDEPPGRHQFLFFIKPDVTLCREAAQFGGILGLILSKIRDFGLHIESIKILSGSYLGKYGVMAQHYGVINQLARDARGNLSDKAKGAFAELYGSPVEEARVLGGFEFLAANPGMTASDLQTLWSRHPNQKLAGGTYCVKIEGKDRPTFLINGFHPQQLEYFTGPKRGIIVFTLRSDLKWSAARQDFTGATNPAVAKAGSLRHELYTNRDAFGLPTISQGANGVHLSAGPVEGLVELRRFSSNFSRKDGIRSFSDFLFGKDLERRFTEPQIAGIVNNVNVTHNGKSVSVFDLTEELDASDALEVLSDVSGQLTP